MRHIIRIILPVVAALFFLNPALKAQDTGEDIVKMLVNRLNNGEEKSVTYAIEGNKVILTCPLPDGMGKDLPVEKVRKLIFTVLRQENNAKAIEAINSMGYQCIFRIPTSDSYIDFPVTANDLK